MKHLYICTVLLLSAAMLTGCVGSIHSNLREIQQLMIIQTMGFDLSEKGVRLSVSTGNSGGGSSESSRTARMSVDGRSITEAEQLLQDHSAAEEILYAHTGYIVLGEDAARRGLSHYLDYIERSTQMRMGTPLFIVTDGTAEELVVGSGGEDFDATSVLRSLERNAEKRGDLRIFSAADTVASLEKNGSALICALRCVDASEALDEAEGELTALPDGYAIIKNGKMIGRVSNDDALGVVILQNKVGPSRLTLSGGAVVELTKCRTELEPVLSGGTVTALRVKTDVKAALIEGNEKNDLNALQSELDALIALKLRNVLELSKQTACDFVGLGGIIESGHPLQYAGTGSELQSSLRDPDISVSVSSELERSLDKALNEVRP